MGEIGVDAIDRKLLRLLQKDASRTNLELSEEVGLSPSSCLRRVRRLWRTGVIDRIVAILNPAEVGRALKAIVTVGLKRHGEREMSTFLETVAREPAVLQAYSVSGDTDIVLFLRLENMEEYGALCDRVFRSVPNVARFQTMLVIKTAKEETAIPT